MNCNREIDKKLLCFLVDKKCKPILQNNFKRCENVTLSQKLLYSFFSFNKSEIMQCNHHSCWPTSKPTCRSVCKSPRYFSRAVNVNTSVNSVGKDDFIFGEDVHSMIALYHFKTLIAHIHI